MKTIKVIVGLTIAMLLLFMTNMLRSPSVVATLKLTPWWMYLVMVGILLSGYFSYKYAKEDREEEQRWIEQEGEKYLEPIRKRRALKLEK